MQISIICRTLTALAALLIFQIIPGQASGDSNTFELHSAPSSKVNLQAPSQVNQRDLKRLATLADLAVTRSRHTTMKQNQPRCVQGALPKGLDQLDFMCPAFLFDKVYADRKSGAFIKTENENTANARCIHSFNEATASLKNATEMELKLNSDPQTHIHNKVSPVSNPSCPSEFFREGESELSEKEKMAVVGEYYDRMTRFKYAQFATIEEIAAADMLLGQQPLSGVKCGDSRIPQTSEWCDKLKGCSSGMANAQKNFNSDMKQLASVVPTFLELKEETDKLAKHMTSDTQKYAPSVYAKAQAEYSEKIQALRLLQSIHPDLANEQFTNKLDRKEIEKEIAFAKDRFQHLDPEKQASVAENAIQPAIAKAKKAAVKENRDALAKKLERLQRGTNCLHSAVTSGACAGMEKIQAEAPPVDFQIKGEEKSDKRQSLEAGKLMASVQCRQEMREAIGEIDSLNRELTIGLVTTAATAGFGSFAASYRVAAATARAGKGFKEAAQLASKAKLFSMGVRGAELVNTPLVAASFDSVNENCFNNNPKLVGGNQNPTSISDFGSGPSCPNGSYEGPQAVREWRSCMMSSLMVLPTLAPYATRLGRIGLASAKRLQETTRVAAAERRAGMRLPQGQTVESIRKMDGPSRAKLAETSLGFKSGQLTNHPDQKVRAIFNKYSEEIHQVKNADGTLGRIEVDANGKIIKSWVDGPARVEKKRLMAKMIDELEATGKLSKADIKRLRDNVLNPADQAIWGSVVAATDNGTPGAAAGARAPPSMDDWSKTSWSGDASAQLDTEYRSAVESLNRQREASIRQLGDNSEWKKNPGLWDTKVEEARAAAKQRAYDKHVADLNKPPAVQAPAAAKVIEANTTGARLGNGNWEDVTKFERTIFENKLKQRGTRMQSANPVISQGYNLPSIQGQPSTFKVLKVTKDFQTEQLRDIQLLVPDSRGSGHHAIGILSAKEHPELAERFFNNLQSGEPVDAGTVYEVIRQLRLKGVDVSF